MGLKKNTVIVLAGSTCAGKTNIGIQLGQLYKTDIVSADSRQCYKELDIGVARPTQKELFMVPHHFIASHSVHEPVTAASFEQFALCKLDEIFKVKSTALVVGGTGLYIKALCNGLDFIPDIPLSIRVGLTEKYRQFGLDWLRGEVEISDPGFLKNAEAQNPQRLLRALEVIRATGKSISCFQKNVIQERSFNVIKIGLEVERELLYQNINKRVDVMMQQGLLAEVAQLLKYQHLQTLQTVGYTELFEHLNNNCSLEYAIDKIKQHTRNYAKRQLTWFKKDLEIKWFGTNQFAKIVRYIESVSNI